MGPLLRRCFYAAAAAVLLSGTAWLALHYCAGSEAPGSASHTAEAWARWNSRGQAARWGPMPSRPR